MYLLFTEVSIQLCFGGRGQYGRYMQLCCILSDLYYSSSHLMNYYFTPSRAWVVEHCDERVFVCMLCLSVRKGISRTSGSNFTKLSVHIGSALSRSCSTGVAISYVLLVLSMTLLLHILV